MWLTGATSFEETMIIGTQIYLTLRCPHCTRVCAKPKDHTHVSSRGTVRTLLGLCLLSLPILWSFRENFGSCSVHGDWHSLNYLLGSD